jgi:hypothetical protein
MEHIQSCNQWFTSHSSKYSGSQFFFSEFLFTMPQFFQGNGPIAIVTAPKTRRNGREVATIQVRDRGMLDIEHQVVSSKHHTA